MQTVTLSLFRFSTPASRLWVLAQMALARLPGVRPPRAEFWKLCGTGTGEGFTPRPNWQVWGIVAVWPDEATARQAVTAAPVYRRWRARAAEMWTILLCPVSARGKWSGRNPLRPVGDADAPANAPFERDADRAADGAADRGNRNGGPLAALTRASLRPSRALRFWARVPDISAMIGSDPSVMFKIGLGEMPLLHQITFSIWPDAAAMARFARGNTAHGRAIQAVRSEDWFTEELYARFRIAGTLGSWGGQCPLTGDHAARAASPIPEMKAMR